MTPGSGIQRTRYYLGDAFVVEHGPAHGEARATGILLLPPLGYEDTSAYRPLRVLADALAASGHAVLRLDWPGLGDSALDAEHPDLVERQVAAVSSAAAALRRRGFSRVAGVGVRAGGLLALAAEGLDELVLWGTPASGKAYLREERAFHKMAARYYGEPPADRQPLPEGAQEAGGFYYNPRTVAALGRLDAIALAAERRLQRALLIPQDGTEPPPALLQALSAAGTEIAVSPIPGLGALLEDPYRAALSADIQAAVAGWLSARSEMIEVQPAAGQAWLGLPGGCAERAWLQPGSSGQLSGIVCEPSGGAKTGASWTIFFNAGGVRRAGPNRLWTRAARALAAAGRPSLRFDVRDVGDSDGASIPHQDLEEMYSETSVFDALQAYDWVSAQGPGSVDVVGLCSGAFMGMQVASRRKVRRAVLFNGLVYVWNDDARASGMTSQIGRSLLDARRWGRLLTGKIDARALARSLVNKTRLTAQERLARLRGRAPLNEVGRLVGEVVIRGTDLRFVSSEGDPSIAYLERHLAAGHLERLTVIPGVDHTIRPFWAHPRVVALITGAR